MKKNEKFKLILQILYDKKGEDLLVLDVDKASDLWEYFIVCTAVSTVHVRTLHHFLADEMKKAGHDTVHRDDGGNDKWVVSDFGDMMVHVFERETRQYYALEKIWGETQRDVSKILKVKIPTGAA